LLGKHLSDAFPIQNYLKQGGASSPLPHNFALEYTSRKIQESQYGLEFNGTHKLLVHAIDINLLDENIKIILVASKNIGLEVNAEKTKYIFMSSH
jgi:hypothetical protein